MRRGTHTTAVAVAVAVSLLPLAGAACAQDSLDAEGALDTEALARIASEAYDGELQKRFDIKYKPGEKKPFSGWFISYHDNGQMRKLEQYKDGKYHGPFLYWHDNGQMNFQGEYVDGERHGKYTEWQDDNKLIAHGRYVRGRRVAWWLEDKAHRFGGGPRELIFFCYEHPYGKELEDGQKCNGQERPTKPCAEERAALYSFAYYSTERDMTEQEEKDYQAKRAAWEECERTWWW